MCQLRRTRLTGLSLAHQVWHNYSFDKHIFENVGINPAGFACDTMHMARLWDSSRALKGYSLEALTSDDEVMDDAGDGFDASRSKSAGLKELFGRPNLKKDGTEGKLVRPCLSACVLLLRPV